MTEEQNKLAEWASKTARQIAHYWGAPHFDLADHLEQAAAALRVEREPATEAVLAQGDKLMQAKLSGFNEGLEEAAKLCETQAPFLPSLAVALRYRALKGKGASQGADDMVMPEREALAFFVATAFGDGFFDDDQGMKERVRAWLLNSANKIREDITIEEVVESLLAASSDEQKG